MSPEPFNPAPPEAASIPPSASVPMRSGGGGAWWFVAVLLLVTGLSLFYNQPLVDGLHRAFGVVDGGMDESRQRVDTPPELTRSLRTTLDRVAVLTAAERAAALAGLPATMAYEYKNLGPYKNIFDFSVFQHRHKSGGVLMVGDSTLSWGFSMPHFAAASGRETHAVTFGLNLMDATLLQAVERIIHCYYDTPPTVLLANALGSMANPARQGTLQDQAVRAISQTNSCEMLYDLVASRRRVGATAFILGSFSAYRERVQRFGRGRLPLSHVQLHRIMEPDKFPGADDPLPWSFLRWQPEFRIPIRANGAYYTWTPAPPGAAQAMGAQYLAEHRDQLPLIRARHRLWAARNTCFILPVTLAAETTLRRSLLAGGSPCWLDFAAVWRMDGGGQPLRMQGNHHLAAEGGIALAVLVGRRIQHQPLPVWE